MTYFGSVVLMIARGNCRKGSVVFFVSLYLFVPVVVASNHYGHSPIPKHHKYIENVYKKVVLNSDGTFGVKVHDKKIRVSHIVGYEALRGGQRWSKYETSLQFNISDLLHQTGKVVAAEFCLALRPHLPEQFMNVTLFLRKNNLTGKELLYAVGWLVVRYTPRGQVSFDVRRAVQHWRQSRELVGKLLVRVGKLSSDANHTLKSLHTRNFFYSGARNGPCLVVYLAEAQDPPLGNKLINSDGIQLPEAKPIQLPDESGRSRRAKSIHCRKIRYDVNLLELFDYVINPLKLPVGLCTGKCIFPLGHHLSPTNHASIVLLMLEHRGVMNRTRPYCVPTHFDPHSIFIYDRKAKQYKMLIWRTAIVARCGCW